MSDETRTHITVLIVNDDPHVLGLAVKILEMAGYEVITANEGRQAVDIYAEHAAEIDLVILDITLPERDGRDVYRALLAIDPDVKVVFSSGFVAENVPGELMAGDIRMPLREPRSIVELCNVVREAFNTSHRTR